MCGGKKTWGNEGKNEKIVVDPWWLEELSSSEYHQVHIKPPIPLQPQARGGSMVLDSQEST